MEQRSSTDSLSLKERIRSLGFDPEQLTIDEQVELLTLHLALPADSRSDIGAPVAGPPDQADQDAV